jgi:hypothetical protein
MSLATDDLESVFNFDAGLPYASKCSLIALLDSGIQPMFPVIGSLPLTGSILICYLGFSPP